MLILSVPYCRRDLRGVAGDIQNCIRGLGKRGRCCEENDYNAALVSNYPRSREKIHHIRTHRSRVAVSHCDIHLLVDNAVHNLVAHDNDSTDSTSPAGDSVLYQVVGLDVEDHCEGVALPLLASPVAAVGAATFHPYFDPCLRTAHCRHYRSYLDLANPHYIRGFQSVAHCELRIPAEARVEYYH